MQFTVSSEVFEKHPDLIIGVIKTTEIDNTNSSPEVAELLRNAEDFVRRTIDVENFKEHPNIAAMQEVHRSFGNNPNKFPPSVQSLVKRILKGGELPSINPVVDLYNVISLRYVVCAGAEDLDACQGDIRLTFADGNESFLPLGDTEESPPEKGELVYRDDVGIICRKLNWREGDRTKISEHTKNAVIVIEGFPPFTQEHLHQAANEVSELLQKYCNAKTEINILTEKAPSCTLN